MNRRRFANSPSSVTTATPGPMVDEPVITVTKSARRIHVETAWKYRKLARFHRGTPRQAHFDLVYGSLRSLVSTNYRRDMYRRRALRDGEMTPAPVTMENL